MYRSIGRLYKRSLLMSAVAGRSNLTAALDGEIRDAFPIRAVPIWDEAGANRPVSEGMSHPV